MIWRGIGVFAALAVLGALAGRVVTADDAAPPTRTVRVGAATLTLAGEWRALTDTTLTDGRRRMRVTFGQPDDRTLLPPGVQANGAPETTRLGGYTARAYGAVAVLPTTRGVLAVDCGCASAIRSVSVAGAAVLVPTPDLALRLRAPSVLATLDAARVSARANWTTTSAQRLADAHRTALAALRPVTASRSSASTSRAVAASGASTPAASWAAGSSHALAASDPSTPAASPADGSSDALAAPALVRMLSDAARAYDRLATSPAARDEVIAADRGVDAAVAALARAGAPAVQRSPASGASGTGGGGVSTPMLVLVLVVAVLFSALAPAAHRRFRARRAHEAAEPEAKPCAIAQRRRKPIAPPPTYGRWNEPPRGPGAVAASGDDDARGHAMASSSTT